MSCFGTCLLEDTYRSAQQLVPLGCCKWPQSCKLLLHHAVPADVTKDHSLQHKHCVVISQ